MQDSITYFRIGRVSLQYTEKPVSIPSSELTTLSLNDDTILVKGLIFPWYCYFCFQMQLQQHKRPFVEIRSSLHVLERIACSVKYNEPVLLVGETGTGKTTIVQNLALRLGQKLTVFVCYEFLYFLFLFYVIYKCVSSVFE